MKEIRTTKNYRQDSLSWETASNTKATYYLPFTPLWSFIRTLHVLLRDPAHTLTLKVHAVQNSVERIEKLSSFQKASFLHLPLMLSARAFFVLVPKFSFWFLPIFHFILSYSWTEVTSVLRFSSLGDETTLISSICYIAILLQSYIFK